MDASPHYVRDIQRQNGKLIIRAMLAVGKATLETIVEKLCNDYNIIFEKENIEKAVRTFLRNGFYSGFLDVIEDGSFVISHTIRHRIEDEFKDGEKSTKRCTSPSAVTNSSKKRRNQSSKK